MDNVNLRDYLSKDEKEQIDTLIRKAMLRKDRKEEASAKTKQFRYFQCQCEGVAEMGKEEDADEKEPWEKEYFEVEIDRLLRGICGFCLKHGLCPYACRNVGKKENEFMDVTDEELPFR